MATIVLQSNHPWKGLNSLCANYY